VKRLALVCAALAVSTASIAQAGDSNSITGTVLVNPLSVTVHVPDSPRKRGAQFRISAAVANAGASRLENVSVTLVRSPALRLDRPATQVIPRIPSLASRRTVWEACSNVPGSYIVLARAEVGPFTAESSGTLVQILSSNRTC
jgi:hypothetical protein